MLVLDFEKTFLRILFYSKVKKNIYKINEEVFNLTNSKHLLLSNRPFSEIPKRTCFT